MDNLFHALKVIGSIEENDKISTSSSGGIHIVHQNMVQSVLRWYNGESRSESLQIMSKVLEDTFTLYKECVDKEEQYVKQQDRKDALQITMSYVEYVHTINIMERLEKELGKVKTGLKNMISTYREDKHTTSHIELMIENIDYTLKEMAQHRLYFKRPQEHITDIQQETLIKTDKSKRQ